MCGNRDRRDDTRNTTVEPTVIVYNTIHVVVLSAEQFADVKGYPDTSYTDSTPTTTTTTPNPSLMLSTPNNNNTEPLADAINPNNTEPLADAINPNNNNTEPFADHLLTYYDVLRHTM